MPNRWIAGRTQGTLTRISLHTDIRDVPGGATATAILRYAV
jgi:hypothetical protein